MHLSSMPRHTHHTHTYTRTHRTHHVPHPFPAPVPASHTDWCRQSNVLCSASLTSSGEDGPPTPGGPVDGLVLGSEKNSSRSKPKGAGQQRDSNKDRPSRSEQMQMAVWNFSRVYPICRAALFVAVGALIGIMWGMQSDEEWSFVEVRSFLFLFLRWLGL